MRQSGEAFEGCGLIKITGQWRQTVITQNRTVRRITGQRINAVTRTQQHRDTQSDVATTDDEQAFHIVSYSSAVIQQQRPDTQR